MQKRALYFGSALGMLTACSGVLADGDGRAFGDDLGDFSVSAELEQSSCGADALGTPTEWEFRIRLSRRDPEFFWNSGAAAVQGRLESDGKTFTLESQTVVEVDPLSTDGLLCSVVRDDRATGVLNDSGLDVDGFEGSLVYRFSEGAGTDCSSLIGVRGGFAQLPCQIRYAMVARLEQSPRR